MAYDFINQQIQSSLLILPKDNDPFFNPTQLALTGFAFDGFYYDGGVRTGKQSSWFLEPQSTYRGILPSFPQAALVLISDVALTILDETNPVTMSSQLPLWMLFLLQDFQALANNFNSSLIGFTPVGLSYGAGILVVNCSPDPGSSIQGNLAINVDFVQDAVYLYTALHP
jgi:hypothetical protein